MPFLVTESKLNRPLMGFNVIRTYIDQAALEEVIKMLTNAMEDVEEKRVRTMVNQSR